MIVADKILSENSIARWNIILLRMTKNLGIFGACAIMSGRNKNNPLKHVCWCYVVVAINKAKTEVFFEIYQ